MINGKQRAYLKKLAQEIDATVYIGKEDLTDNILTEMDRYLDVHELVKVKIQEGSMLEPKHTANQCADALKAEFVQAIGRKFVLYRAAAKSENRTIVLPK